MLSVRVAPSRGTALSLAAQGCFLRSVRFKTRKESFGRFDRLLHEPVMVVFKIVEMIFEISENPLAVLEKRVWMVEPHLFRRQHRSKSTGRLD